MHLTVENLSKRYASNGPWALQDIDLQVSPGEFIAILGPSGAGKSTLVRCINRLIEPTTGAIFWGDTDLLSLDPNALRAKRRQIAMVFQEFHLIDRLDVLTNVLVGRFGALTPWQVLTGRYPLDDVRLARECLARVGLAAYETRRARELSGGQRQRVAIARALAQRPRMILGDEPVSNLDPATAHGIMQLLEEVNGQDGITLILNLHSVELAVRFARRIIGMNSGRIVFDGAPDALTTEVLTRIYGAAPPLADPAALPAPGHQHV